MNLDARGLPLTAANEAAVQHFDEVIAEFLRFGRETGTYLKQALAADPEFLMGHCIKGYFFQLFCNPVLGTKAKRSLDTASSSMSGRGATPRERQHVQALRAWIEGDLRAAVGTWEVILLDDPRDVLALKLAHFMHFYLGDELQLRDSVARVLHAWDESTAGYSYLLGMHAFGLEESGDYEQAERTGRRAVESNADDPWAVHAVAHVMEMQDRRSESIAWLKNLESNWSACNNFAYHLWWHRCLSHLELEQFDDVLELYDSKMRADQSDEYLDVCNATSLLWRLEERGVGVGSRWDELADKAETHMHDHLLVFPDAHYLLALAATGRTAATGRMLDSIRETAQSSGVTEAEIAVEVGLPLGVAIAAWYEGDYRQVVDSLLPVRYLLVKIGGSHAQRDLFHQILIAASIRSAQFDIARALLSERTHLKADNAWSWKRYAEVSSALDDEQGARAARQRAENLLTV